MSVFNTQTGTVEKFTTYDYKWQAVEFDQAFPDGVVPLVFAQIQTYAGTDSPGLRLKNISNTGFEVCMREVYVSYAKSSVVGDLGTVQGNSDHSSEETLAWMAVSMG